MKNVSLSAVEDSPYRKASSCKPFDCAQGDMAVNIPSAKIKQLKHE